MSSNSAKLIKNFENYNKNINISACRSTIDDYDLSLY